MPPPERLIEHAEELLPEALHWLRRMVGINSFTANAAGVNQLVALTTECFAPLGFSATAVPSAHPDYGHHLFLQRLPTAVLGKDSRPVMLVTHSDTVFPAEEEARNHFYWREDPEQGRIYGPGVVDNKGGTIMIWLMLRIMQLHLPSLFEGTHWLVAVNATEEVIGAEFAACSRDMAPEGARAVFVFEGGRRLGNEYQLVTSRKGRAEYRIRCIGRAAHAGSNHAEGVNAVVELAAVLPQVAAITDPARHLTVNVATMTGGTVLNRVPHEAVAELEMRSFEPQVMAEAEQRLAKVAGTTATGATITVECMGHSPAWPGGEPTEALVRHWEGAARALGGHVKPGSRGGLSDANYLNGLGPTLDALGPSGGHAHCSETSEDGAKQPEYVEPNSFAPKAALNILGLCGFLGVKDAYL